MKNILCFCLFVMSVDLSVSQIAAPVDTVFAKGGTCLYKIYKEYNACMNAQQERLDREGRELTPYTLAEQQSGLNRIGCCAYWEFLSCVERAADEKCINDRTDMEAYTRQMGSSIPMDICKEEFPKDSDLCSGSQIITFSSILCLIAFVIQMLFK